MTEPLTCLSSSCVMQGQTLLTGCQCLPVLVVAWGLVVCQAAALLQVRGIIRCSEPVFILWILGAAATNSVQLRCEKGDGTL